VQHLLQKMQLSSPFLWWQRHWLIGDTCAAQVTPPVRGCTACCI